MGTQCTIRTLRSNVMQAIKLPCHPAKLLPIKAPVELSAQNTTQFQPGSEALPNSQSAHKVNFTTQTRNKNETKKLLTTYHGRKKSRTR